MASPTRSSRVPTAEELTLGIDLGTSSVKVVVADPGGAVRAVASAPYEVASAHPGWAETRPGDWWQAVISAVRQATSGVPVAAIAGLGLSGQMHGLVLTAASGDAVRAAILHLDTRAHAYLDRYRALPDAALDRLANPLSPNMAGPMLLWAAEHAAAEYAVARWALQPKDWVRLQLTGEVAAEPSDASATLLFDVPGNCWDGDTVEALHLRPEMLPPVLESAGALAGRLSSAAAQALGLPVGVPVAAGGGDTAVAALGAGLMQAGDVQLTIGTSGQVITPLTYPSASIQTGTHLYRTATPHGWYGMGAVLNGGLALNWVRQVLGVDWPTLYAVASAPATDDDPYFLPHLTGERTPYLDPHMRGAWTQLGLATDRTRLLRSALEGVACALGQALDALPGGAGTQPIRLAGGGTTSPAWRQLLADVLTRPLRPVDLPDVSGRGAALLGAVAAGLIGFDDIGTRLAPALGELTSPRPELCDVFARRRSGFADQVTRLR
jgi:xylulokinase